MDSDANVFCKIMIFIKTGIPCTSLPTTVLKIGPHEKQLLVEDIRSQLHTKISQNGEKLKSVLEYGLYFSDGKRLEEVAFLSAYMDQLNSKYMNLFFTYVPLEEELKKEIAKQHEIDKKKIFVEEEERKKVETQKEHEPILNALKLDLREKFTFQKLIGDLNFIVFHPGLNSPRQKFDKEQVIKLKNYIQFANEIQQTHEFQSESDRHFLITFILNLALKFINGCFMHNEFYIRPPFEVEEKQKKGIERKADCVIYENLISNVICLSEIKKSDEDIDDCIRQNADQLRAYCICNNKSICRGIATTAEKWYFTEYTKKNLEILVVSKPFVILERKDPRKVYLIKEDCLEFFEVLLGFINESLVLMKNQ